MTRFTLPRAAALLSLLASGAASAYNSGASNYSGVGGATCAACHNVTNTSVYNMALVGPTLVAPNSVNAYSFNETYVSGAKAPGGGFDLETTAGTFATVTAGERLWDTNTEITHNPNQAGVNGNMSWNFTWTAPATGSANMTVCGLARYGKANAEVMSCSSRSVSVNTAPVANDDSLPVGKNSGSLLIDVLANDTNNDSNDSLSLMSVSTPSNGGVATIVGDKIDYHPATGYVGTETFDYTLQDTLGLTDTGTVTVNVVNSVLIKFGAASDYTVGGSYNAGVVTCDINRDGKQDFIVTDPGAGNVTVFLNSTPRFSSTPTFLAGVDFAVGTGPRSIAEGDLDKDGAHDLVTANGGSDDISVLMNTTVPGSMVPTFASALTITTLTGPLAVIVKDLNKDTKADVAVLHNDTKVRILLNNTATGASAPSFATPGDVDTGASPFGFTIDNFLNNGRYDLAIGNGGGDQDVLVYRNQTTTTSAPVFTDGTVFEYNGFGIVRALSSADLNGDGIVDIAAVDEGNSKIVVLRNTAPAHATVPSFAPKQTFAVDNVNDNPAALVAQDLNGDGKAEIVATSGQGHLNVLTNATPTNATTITLLTPVPVSVGTDFTAAVASADFNGDGQSDLVTVGGYSPHNFASVAFNQTRCTLRLAAANVVVTEGTATADVTVKRSGGGCAAGSVQFKTTNGTAIAGKDYTVTGQTLSWALGDTSDQVVHIPITADALDEDTETFNVSLVSANPDLNTALPNGIVTIKDANAAPSVTVDKTAQTVDEGPAGQYRLVNLQLSAVSGKTVTVPFTLSGTATAGADYTTTMASPVVFAPGQLRKTVRFDVVDDAATEGAETATLTINAPTNATMGTPKAYTMTIKASD